MHYLVETYIIITTFNILPYNFSNNILDDNISINNNLCYNKKI